MSEGLEIQGQRRRLLRRNDGPWELATTTEALEVEDKLKVLIIDNKGVNLGSKRYNSSE